MLLTTGGGLGGGGIDSNSSGELLSGLGLCCGSGGGNAGHNCGVVPQPQAWPSNAYVDGLLGQQVSALKMLN